MSYFTINYIAINSKMIIKNLLDKITSFMEFKNWLI